VSPAFIELLSDICLDVSIVEGLDIVLESVVGAVVIVFDESLVVEPSLLLLQAAKVPAIANITNNFFIVLFGFS
jgi:hypothetical protein